MGLIADVSCNITTQLCSLLLSIKPNIEKQAKKKKFYINIDQNIYFLKL